MGEILIWISLAEFLSKYFGLLWIKAMFKKLRLSKVRLEKVKLSKVCKFV